MAENDSQNIADLELLKLRKRKLKCKENEDHAPRSHIVVLYMRGVRRPTKRYPFWRVRRPPNGTQGTRGEGAIVFPGILEIRFERSSDLEEREETWGWNVHLI